MKHIFTIVTTLLYALFVALLLSMQFEASKSTLQPTSKIVKDKDKLKLVTWSGTATAISRDGYYITAAHVIKGAVVMVIKDGVDGVTNLATVVAVDYVNDIAIIKSKPITKRIISYLDSTRIADTAISCGFSLQQVFNKCSYAEGRIANVGKGVAYNNSPISHGDSGSGVINNQGELIGVVSGIYVNEYGAHVPKSGVFISNEPINTLLKSIGITLEKSAGYILSQDSLTELITKSSVMIKAAGFVGGE